MTAKRTEIIWVIFALLTLEALFSVPLLSWEVAVGNQRVWGGWFASAALVVICFVIWRWSGGWDGTLHALSTQIGRISNKRLLWLAFLIGTTLRVLWVALYPAPQHSDQAVYFGLARNLVEHHGYSMPQIGLAYWPPGYPFFLAAWFVIFGFKYWVPLIANLVLFGGSLLVVERLSRRIGGASAAHLSVLIFALWPTMIMTAGMASKEMLVVFLIPLALLTYYNAQDAAWTFKGIGLTVLAGSLIACASLTQPSLLLFVSIAAATEWFRRERLSHAIGRLAILATVMALVILPWTLRNHRIIGAWVPISTNGGDVFYRANNPLATGGYTPVGEQSFEGADEVQRGKLGFRLGEEWIRTHPGRFLALAVRKEILFLGDDAQGAFETLKRGLGIGGLRYLFWKGVSNLYWWIVWIVILLGLVIHRRQRLVSDPLLASAMLSILYLFAIHSVFESGSKYHEPLFGLIAAIAGQVFANEKLPEKADATA